MTMATTTRRRPTAASPPTHWICRNSSCKARNSDELTSCDRCGRHRAGADDDRVGFQRWKTRLSELAVIDGVDHERLLDVYYQDDEPGPAVAVGILGLTLRELPETQEEAAAKEADAVHSFGTGTEFSPPRARGKTKASKGSVARFETAPSNSPRAGQRIGTENISVDFITVSKLNPRQTFDQEKLRQLGESLRKLQIEPIAVRGEGPYELLWGERRLRAARLVGLPTLRAEIYECSDQEAVFLRGEENERREALDPIEQAIWYQQLLDTGLTQQQVADMVGCEQAKVSLAVGMLKLPKEWQERVIAREISGTHTKALLPWKERPTVLAKLSKAMEEWKKPKYGDPRTGTIPSREFERMVEDAVEKCTRPLRKARPHELGGCHFNVTKQLREQLDVVSVKNRWGGAPVPRAFNVTLWNKLNKEAKAEKKKAEASPAPKRQAPEGPYAYLVDRTLKESIGRMVAARLKKSDRETTLRLLLLGCDSELAHVASGGKDGYYSDREKWDWLAPLEKGKLESAAFEVVKASLEAGDIDVEALLPIAAELGLNVKAEWKASEEDLGIFPIESLEKMPAAKRCGYAGKEKAQLIKAMVDSWQPGEMPKEFARELKDV